MQDNESKLLSKCLSIITIAAAIIGPYFIHERSISDVRVDLAKVQVKIDNIEKALSNDVFVKSNQIPHQDTNQQ